MALFRQLDDHVDQLLALLNKDERWLIVINADPDALGSAYALKRIMTRRVNNVAIAQINEIQRPDNLSMIRYCRIPTQKLIPNLAAQFDKFALVDSQPHHNPEFKDFNFPWSSTITRCPRKTWSLRISWTSGPSTARSAP